MTTVTATEARQSLTKLLNEVAEFHLPILIAGKHGNAVLIAEEDWIAIQETLHLVSNSATRESILEGMRTPIEECEEDLDW